MMFRGVHFRFIPIGRVVPIVGSEFGTSTSSNFHLFQRDYVRITFAFVLEVNVGVGIRSFIASNFRYFLIAVPQVVVRVRERRPVFREAYSRYCYFAFWRDCGCC